METDKPCIQDRALKVTHEKKNHRPRNIFEAVISQFLLLAIVAVTSFAVTPRICFRRGIKGKRTKEANEAGIKKRVFAG